jgi:hypothetical protein
VLGRNNNYVGALVETRQGEYSGIVRQSEPISRGEDG